MREGFGTLTYSKTTLRYWKNVLSAFSNLFEGEIRAGLLRKNENM